MSWGNHHHRDASYGEQAAWIIVIVLVFLLAAGADSLTALIK